MNLKQEANSWQLPGNPTSRYGVALFGVLAIAWLLWSVLRTFEPSGSQLLRALATAISVPILLVWFHNREKLAGRVRKLLWVLVLAIIAIFAAGSALIVFLNVIHPPEWDFLTFWLDGHVAIRGLNFYEPANYQAVPLPITPSGAFTPEILDVGFRYPPPTMLLFMPLGLLDIRTAIVVWYAAHGVVLAWCVVLLWKTFLGKNGLTGLVFAIALVAVVAGTFSTFQYAQTNFLALLMLLLFWRDREKLRGGAWLTIGAFVKPFLLLLLMIPMIRKKWRVLLGALITLVAISVLTISVVGIETFLAYFSDNPAGRAADFVYTETTNQSLLATILRLGEYDINDRSMLTHPVYVGTAIILTAITGWLLHSLKGDSADWGLGLVLILALIVYPASQFFYSVFLLVPLLLLWVRREEIPTGAAGTGALITVIFVLITIGGYVFVANILLWSILAALSGWILLSRGSRSSELQRNLQWPEVGRRMVKQTSGSIQ